MAVTRPTPLYERWQTLDLPVVNLRQARRETWLSWRRRPVGLRLAGEVWNLTACAVDPLRGEAGWVRILLVDADGDVLLYAPPGALAAWIQHRYPGTVLADLDPGLLPLLLEDAMADLLGRLESGGHGPIRVRAVDFDTRPTFSASTAFMVAREGQPPFPVVVDGRAALRDALDAFIDAQPLDPFRRSDLRIDLAFCAGASTVACGELDRLRIGDAILLETSLLSSEKVACVAGGAVGQTCSVQASGFVLDGPLQPSSAFPGRHPMAAVMARDEDGDNDDGRPRDLPVRLVFELGRLGMPLAEVATLGAGYAFDLGRSQQTLVDIVAAGIRIGTGSLMKIADGIGVRVNQIAR